jgi:hypothetical protein
MCIKLGFKASRPDIVKPCRDAISGKAISSFQRICLVGQTVKAENSKRQTTLDAD